MKHFLGTQTSESVGTAPVRQVAQAEIVEAVEIGVPPSAESASPMFGKAPVLEAPPVAVGHVQPTTVEIQRPVPTSRTVQKTVENTQAQHIEHIVNVPVVSQRQALTIQTDTVKVRQKQFPHQVVDVPVVTQQRHDPVPHVMTDEVTQKMVEVTRVIPQERVVRPTGEGSSVRERAKRFEKEWGAKHMTSVEGPRPSHDERQKESPVSDAEQDTCGSTGQSLGAVSLTDQAMETVDVQIVPREVQPQTGEMTLTAGDHELKVVAHVESAKGEAAAQEREVESSKRRRQESNLESQIPVRRA